MLATAQTLDAYRMLARNAATRGITLAVGASGDKAGWVRDPELGGTVDVDALEDASSPKLNKELQSSIRQPHTIETQGIEKRKSRNCFPPPWAQERRREAYVISPDKLKIESLEDPQQTIPSTMHQIHCFVTEQELPKMREYNVQTYGAVAGKRGAFEVANLPGVELTFSNRRSRPAPQRDWRWITLASKS